VVKWAFEWEFSKKQENGFSVWSKKSKNIGFLSPFSTNGSGRLKDGKGNGFYDVMYLFFFLHED
jgi:hypothetical protein